MDAFKGTITHIPDEMKIALGRAGSAAQVFKFGANGAVGTSFTPITQSGFYRTPQVSAATKLRVKAGNANDTAAGSGAREVTIVGLNASGEQIENVLATAGASASADSDDTFIRLFRAWVSKSGTYGSQSAGSHSADIVIENAAGTEDWLKITSTGFPAGQSEVSAYTVPLNKRALLLSIEIHVETNKAVDILMFKRESILDAAAPYQAMRVVERFEGLVDEKSTFRVLPQPFDELTDIGFMGKVATGTAEVSILFEICTFDENGA